MVHCTLLSRSQPLWSILIKQMFSVKVIAPIVVTGLGNPSLYANWELCFVPGKGLLNTSPQFKVRKPCVSNPQLCVSIPLSLDQLQFIHLSGMLWQQCSKHLCLLEAEEGKIDFVSLLVCILAFFLVLFCLVVETSGGKCEICLEQY